MTFWHRQKVRAAMGFLKWRFESKKQPPPGEAELERQAEALVADARQVAQRTGRNIMVILKEMINDLKK